MHLWRASLSISTGSDFTFHTIYYCCFFLVTSLLCIPSIPCPARAFKIFRIWSRSKAHNQRSRYTTWCTWLQYRILYPVLPWNPTGLVPHTLLQTVLFCWLVYAGSHWNHEPSWRRFSHLELIFFYSITFLSKSVFRCTIQRLDNFSWYVICSFSFSRWFSIHCGFNLCFMNTISPTNRVPLRISFIIYT